VLTDGKAGDEIPCIGVAEELLGVRDGLLHQLGASPAVSGLSHPAAQARYVYGESTVEIHRVAPRPPWVWMMPRGPIDPREGSRQPGSPIAPPFPDILIASGRRAVPYVREIKRLAGAATFAVILKNPRIANHGADFVWVPEHDRAQNPQFARTLTTPHRFSATRIAAARSDLGPEIRLLPHPRVAILLGGRTRLGPFSAADTEALCQRLTSVAEEAGSFLVTVSRRTPPQLLAAVQHAIRSRRSYVWEGDGPNPYLRILAAADSVVATGDSHTMISEAAAIGRPLMIFAPTCIKPKLTYFGLRMIEEGWAHPFDGGLQRASVIPHDSTPAVAEAIRRQFSGEKSRAPG
jgi:uncharacterized protein